MLEPNDLPIPRRFALLGATGHTGRLVLQKLLESGMDDLEVHVYVRSLQKLEALFPSIQTDQRVTIFQGNINDHILMRNCIKGAENIICTLGENENIPGVRVLQDFAHTLLWALESLKREAMQWIRPRLLLLSSATWNPGFAATRPALLHWMIRNAFARPYDDLLKAQELLLATPTTLSVLLVQPNALVKEKASGCDISTEFARVAVSYEDLAEGFVRLATLQAYATVTAVGVSSRKAENSLRYLPFVLGKVFRGLLFQYIPGYWRAEYAMYNMLAGYKQKAKEQ